MRDEPETQHLFGPDWVRFNRFISDFQKRLPQIFTAVQAFAENFERTVGPLVRYHAKIQRIEKAGWLPHYTLPMDLISDDEGNVSAVIEHHYRTNWTDIQQQFLKSIDTLNLDNEAKAAFSEALCAHEHGLYRATCRVLFPEIERLARIELLGGSAENIASLKELQDAAGELGLSEMVVPGLAGFALYRRLAEHMYLPVRTAEEIEKFDRDSVPNRHASIHGRVVYKTFQHSINMLVMADFLLNAIATIKKNRQHKGDT
jgi:hypothetical protein